MGMIVGYVQQGLASLSRLNRVYAEPQPNEEGLRAPAQTRADIELRNLSFYYPGRSQAALPYATKLALDLYIAPVGPRLQLPPGTELPEQLRPALAQGHLIDSHLQGLFFFTPQGLKELDPRLKTRLSEAGFLSPQKFYARPLPQGPEGEKLLAMASAQPELFSRQGRLIVLEEKDLGRLPPALALNWRAEHLAGLKRLALAFGLIILLGFGCAFGQKVVLELAAQKLALKLRQKSLVHLMSLSQSFFDRQDSARLTSRLTNDVNNLAIVAKSTVSVFFSDLASLALVLTLMFALDIHLTLLTLAFVPPALLLSF